MKWIRMLVLLGMVGLATSACSNPTVPRYPQEEEKPGEDPPPSQGLHLSALPLTFLA